MNDDELNELLARHESETVIFREMDVKRERDALEVWRQAGNRGKVPLPLIQLEELLECYQTDQPFDVKDTEEVFEGRGQRRRYVVSYDDALDDDTWAMVRDTYVVRQGSNSIQVLEDGEDIQELTDRAREKKKRQVQNPFLLLRHLRYFNAADNEVPGQKTLVSDFVDDGRKPKKGKAEANNCEAAVGSK
jgi:ATP-dependent helicase STH1/SNF2